MSLKNFVYITVCSITLLLTACSQDEKVVLNEMRGDYVVLKVGFDGIQEQTATPIRTKADEAAAFVLEEDLGDGLVMETQVMPLSGVDTKASTTTTPIDPNVQILAVVYKTDGTPYKFQYLTPGKAEILLPLGQKYEILFYSHNESNIKPLVKIDGGTAIPDGIGGFIIPPGAKVAELYGNNYCALWHRIITEEVSQTTKLPNIQFSPITCKIKWTVDSEFNILSTELRNLYGGIVVNPDMLMTGLDIRQVYTGVSDGKEIIYLTPVGQSFVCERKDFPVKTDSYPHLWISLSEGVEWLERTLPIAVEPGKSYDIKTKIYRQRMSLAPGYLYYDVKDQQYKNYDNPYIRQNVTVDTKIHEIIDRFVPGAGLIRDYQPVTNPTPPMIDLCAQVHPEGTWRMPLKNELNNYCRAAKESSFDPGFRAYYKVDGTFDYLRMQSTHGSSFLGVPFDGEWVLRPRYASFESFEVVFGNYDLRSRNIMSKSTNGQISVDPVMIRCVKN